MTKFKKDGKKLCKHETPMGKVGQVHPCQRWATTKSGFCKHHMTTEDIRSELELQIAKEFSKELISEIGMDNIKEVIDQNTDPENDGFCASHNYCDPNPIMLDALKKVLADHGDENAKSPDFEIDDSEIYLQTWNKAWDIADENDFFIPKKEGK